VKSGSLIRDSEIAIEILDLTTQSSEVVHLRDGRREPLSQLVTRHGKTRPALLLSISCARDRSPTAETPRGSVHESPVRRQPHAHKRRSSEDLSSGNLDFFASVCPRVIDPDLKHWKTLLQFFSTGPGAFPGGKFGF
jgi:hypothetical protein